LLILDLWGISFHAVVVFGLGKNLLFKSILGRCDSPQPRIDFSYYEISGPDGRHLFSYLWHVVKCAQILSRAFVGSILTMGSNALQCRSYIFFNPKDFSKGFHKEILCLKIDKEFQKKKRNKNQMRFNLGFSVILHLMHNGNDIFSSFIKVS
jgi:hypothetical protein